MRTGDLKKSKHTGHFNSSSIFGIFECATFGILPITQLPISTTAVLVLSREMSVNEAFPCDQNLGRRRSAKIAENTQQQG